jgi:hypothetical protein
LSTWKKLIVSGSNAQLESLTLSNGGTITGSLLISGSVQLTGSLFISGANQIIGTVQETKLSGSFSGSFSGNLGSVASIIDNNVDNYIVTATGGTKLNGEQNLQFDSTPTRKVLKLTSGYIDLTDVNASNLAIGSGSLVSVTTGISNLSIGSASMKSTTDGYNNIAIGIESLTSNTSGYNNTVIGFRSGIAVSTANENTFLGYAAGFKATGGENIVIGSKAGGSLTTGTSNVIIGYNSVNSETKNLLGTLNTIVGSYSAQKLNSGSQNTFIGAYAGQNLESGSFNTAIGYGVFGSKNSGSFNTAIGYGSMGRVESNHRFGVYNVAIGIESLYAATPGEHNVGIGYQTLRSVNSTSTTTGGHNIGIGHSAGYAIGGNGNGGHILIGSYVVSGSSPGGNPRSVSANLGSVIGIGFGALRNTYGNISETIAIGSGSGAKLQDSTGNLIIGHDSLSEVTSVNVSSIILGHKSAKYDGVGNNIVIGHSSLSNSGLSGTGNIVIGNLIASAITSGDDNVLIGGGAGDRISTGDSNVAIGTNAGISITTGTGNLFVGYAAGNNSGINLTGNNNVVLGRSAGLDITSGFENTLSGYLAGESITTGDSNVFVGALSGDTVTTGDDNIFIGRGAGNPGNGANPTNDSQNNIIIGTNIGIYNAAAATANNNFVLGNYNTDRYYYFGDLNQQINGSDERDKISIATSSLGLDFIREVQPKTYRWNKRSRYLNDADNDQRFADSESSYGIIIQDILSLTGSYPQITSSFQIGSGSYTGGDYYESYAISLAGFLWPTVQAVKDLDSITAKTGSNTFTGLQTISGSLRMSGSTMSGLFINNLTTTTDNLNRLTYNSATGRVFYEPHKFVSTSSIGDGVSTSFTLTHNLNSTNIQVNIQDPVTGEVWYSTRDTGSNPMSGMYHVRYTDQNTITINFHSSYPPTLGQYVVIVSK